MHNNVGTVPHSAKDTRESSTGGERNAPDVRVAKRRILSNVAWNWAGMLTQALVGLALAPFLIDHLGDAIYGLWILMWSLTEGLGLIDLGVRSSVGRQIAFRRSQGDQSAVNSTLSSSLAILCCVGVFILVATVLLSSFLSHFADVPAAELPAAQNAMILVGLGFAVHVVLSSFDATLWAFERFDSLNRIDIPSMILRAVLTYGIMSRGAGLEALAMITWGSMILAGAAKGVMCFRFDPNLRVGLRWIEPKAIRDLYGYGVWTAATSAGTRIRTALTPVLISSTLSLALITPFSLSARLIGYAVMFMHATTGVLTPFATALDAQRMTTHLRRLVLEGGKLSLSLTLYFSIWLIFLGSFFIALWTDPRFAEFSVILIVLTCGELLPLSQLVNRSIIMATARHRTLAQWTLWEGIAGPILGAALMLPYGLVGLCVGLSIAAAICRGVLILVYTCRFTEISLSEYVKTVILRNIVVAVPPALTLWALIRIAPPETWARLVVYSLIFTTMFAISAVPLIGVGRIAFEGRRLLRQSRRFRNWADAD